MRIVRNPQKGPSDYDIRICDAKTGRTLLDLPNTGGIDTYSEATPSVHWHASGKFIAITDCGTRHTRELYIIALSNGQWRSLKVPDYIQNALGRVDATHAALYCMSSPSKWNGDDLHLLLYFDVETDRADKEHPFYTSKVVLRLRYKDQMPRVTLTSVSSPQPAEAGLPRGPLENG